MDTQTLVESLKKITADGGEYEWKFCFYTAKASKDGVNLEIGGCAMKDIAGLVDATVVNMLEKVLPERTVTEYTPFLSKEEIGALEQTDELVREPLGDILSGVKNAYPFTAEDYVIGAAPTPTGYLFYGSKKEEKAEDPAETGSPVLMIRRSNPFLKSSRSRLCVTAGGQIVTSETPILKFAETVDLLVVDGVCYILTPSIEKDLGMESRQAAITAGRMKVIAESSIADNYEELEKVAYSGKNMRKFMDFDRDVLDYIVRLPLLERADFLSEYGLTMNEQGLVDTNDDEQCGLFIDLLCGRSCHDALGRLSVGSNIVPR